MLLRSSRQAAYLTKQAFIGSLVRAGAKAVGKGTVKGLAATGKFVKKHPVGSLATVAGTTAGAVEAGQDLRRAQIGMSPRWQKAKRMGYVKQPMPTRAQLQGR